MRRMRHLRLLCSVLIILSVVVGCTKKESRASAGATAKPATGGVAQPSGGTIRLHPVGASRAGLLPAIPRAPKAVSTLPSGTDQLLAMRGGRTVFPSDFDIGALQPKMPEGTAQGAILLCVDQFFAQLAKGHVDTLLLSPTWRDDIVRFLSYPVDNGELPTAVRIGKLSIEREKAHAPIRMERGKGRSDGEIYLERVDSRWLISDIQADFGKLLIPFVRKQAFDPAEWKSLMKE